jgi:homoserine dehydrogenase
VRAPFRIGVLGFGNVGKALVQRFVDDADSLAAAAGRPLVLECIGVARNLERPAPVPLELSEAVVQRSNLDGIVELIGGAEPAHTYISASLRRGRQVITANKQLIAAHGPALAAIGPLRFEASVGSAIPAIEMLAETLAADHIDSVVGILNGTTNSMLDLMEGGASYADALADAQRKGMAEADPTADVDGHDAAAKLAILIMLAFRQWIDASAIPRNGIRKIERQHIQAAKKQGCTVKLVAAARFTGDSVEADVEPRLVPNADPMARVNGPFNAIAIEAKYAGKLMLTGPGAGPEAAASAVVADLIRAARDIPPAAGNVLSTLADRKAIQVTPLGTAGPFPQLAS